jgi:hypothetical protein
MLRYNLRYRPITYVIVFGYSLPFTMTPFDPKKVSVEDIGEIGLMAIGLGKIRAKR